MITKIKRSDCVGSPKILVIAGPNGSGKSSIASDKVRRALNERIINPDNYAEGLSDDMPDRTKRYIVAMEACNNIRESMMKCHESFGFETIGSTEDKVEFIKRAVDEGYEVSLIYVTLNDPGLCLSRIKKRVSEGGHDVDPEKVRSRYFKSMQNLHKFLELSDRANVYDNSGDKPQIVFMKKDGEYILCVDPEEYEWVNTYILGYFKDVKKVY
ncbi:MAG: zeta toxin family protein [Candidatus Methanoplasma sp.]|jgi:predicted ABC-type ATPase|nr:zeta toxin family protein [Candidatus Methanoplasma sp.]